MRDMMRHVLHASNPAMFQGCVHVAASSSLPHDMWLPPNSIVYGPSSATSCNTAAEEMLQVMCDVLCVMLGMWCEKCDV